MLLNESLLEFYNHVDKNKILPTDVKNHVCQLILDKYPDILIAQKILLEFHGVMEQQTEIKDIWDLQHDKQLTKVWDTLIYSYPTINPDLLKAISAQKWYVEKPCYDRIAINYYNTLVKTILELHLIRQGAHDTFLENESFICKYYELEFMLKRDEEWLHI